MMTLSIRLGVVFQAGHRDCITCGSDYFTKVDIILHSILSVSDYLASQGYTKVTEEHSCEIPPVFK